MRGIDSNTNLILGSIGERWPQWFVFLSERKNKMTKTMEIAQLCADLIHFCTFE